MCHPFTLIFCKALSLALEVDVHNMNTELSDILEREFVNGAEIESTGVSLEVIYALSTFFAS